MGSEITLRGLAVPWNVPSTDSRKSDDPLAQGRAYSLLYRADALEVETEEYIPLLFGHESKVHLAQTADSSLRIWSTDEGLMFEARLRDNDFSREVAHQVGRRRYGVSVEAYNFFRRYCYVGKTWCRAVHHGTLSHLAILEDPAFVETWVRIAAPAAVRTFRNRAQVRSFGGGFRICA